MSRLVGLYEKWEKGRDSRFLGMIEHDQDASVVDLGCGTGRFTLKVSERVGCGEIYGVDVWEEGLKEAKIKGVKTQRMDLNERLNFPDKSFNVVVSNQVIEHLFFPSKFVQEIHRILKKDGYMVMSTENLASWDNIISLLFGYTPFSVEFDSIKIGNPFSPHNKEGRGNYPSHVRVFSYQGLIDLLEFHRFKTENISATGYLPFNFLANLNPRHARFIIVKARK